MTDVGHGWVERRWSAMGSDAHCLVATDDEDLVSAVIDQLEHLERCWSRFRADSELVALNACPHEEVVVTPTLADAVRRAVLAWELTDGWFDPTVLEALEVAGYRRSFADEAMERGVWPERRAAPTPAEVSVDLDSCIVRRPPGLRLDLGGVGKGLAADLLATHLVDAGAIGCCVSLGGDVRVAGLAPEGGWRIPVQQPGLTALGAPGPTWFDATLGQGAVVTSTTRLRRWRTIDGHDAHHLIDPRSGQPSHSGVASAVVVAAEAWWAESLAKAALLAGPVEGQRLLERHDAQGWFDMDGSGVLDRSVEHLHRVAG